MTPRELKRLRKKAGLNMTDFAKMLMVAVNTVSQWESGKRRITPSRAEYIKMKLKERVARIQGAA